MERGGELYSCVAEAQLTPAPLHRHSKSASHNSPKGRPVTAISVASCQVLGIRKFLSANDLFGTKAPTLVSRRNVPARPHSSTQSPLGPAACSRSATGVKRHPIAAPPLTMHPTMCTSLFVRVLRLFAREFDSLLVFVSASTGTREYCLLVLFVWPLCV